MSVVGFDDDDSTRSSREFSAASCLWQGPRPRVEHHRRLTLLALSTVAVAYVAGCSSSSNDSVTPAPSAKPTGVRSSSPTLPDAPASSAPGPSSPGSAATASTGKAAQSAVAAFLQYITATFYAQRAPREAGDSYSLAADFTRYSFDPMRGQENAYIASLAAGDEAFRGTPPTPRVHVSRTDLDAKPYPIVVLTNCPAPTSTWVAYDTKTGRPVAYTKTKVPPPYLATVTMIFYQDRWGVQKISVDTGRTCNA